MIEKSRLTKVCFANQANKSTRSVLFSRQFLVFEKNTHILSSSCRVLGQAYRVDIMSVLRYTLHVYSLDL